VRLQDVGRLLFAAAFFVGAVANTMMLLTSPQIYEGFADLSLLGFYRTLWRRLIVPNLGVWVALVIVFEIGVGALLLAPDPYARVGLILAAAFTLFLVPFWWGGGALVNVVLFALLLWLLGFDYADSAVSLLLGGRALCSWCAIQRVPNGPSRGAATDRGVVFARGWRDC